MISRLKPDFRMLNIQEKKGVEVYAGRTPLRHCATSLKVAGSIPDAVNGTFH
jgi:hypothetical protein